MRTREADAIKGDKITSEKKVFVSCLYRNHGNASLKESYQRIEELKVKLRFLRPHVDFRFVARGTSKIQHRLFTDLAPEVSAETIATKLARASR